MSNITNVPFSPAAAHVMSTADQRDLRPEVLNDDGSLRIVPASYYRATSPTERALLGNRAGLYGLPTSELIAWLEGRIAGRSAIEIGAGDGLISAVLGIPGTDSKMQDDPKVTALYKQIGQTTVPYGAHVKKLDAKDAIAQYKPQVVIAQWVTHQYKKDRHEAGGNIYGVNEEAVLARCEEYIFIGNEEVHKGKSIWNLPHEIFYPNWLFSRAINGSRDFIAVWPGTRPKVIK